MIAVSSSTFNLPRRLSEAESNHDSIFWQPDSNIGSPTSPKVSTRHCRQMFLTKEEARRSTINAG
jgi:hypothetical protein